MIKMNRKKKFIPYQLQIEVTNICNLNCAGCMRASESDTLSNMKPDLFYYILDMIDCNVSVTPWINGETTLHPKFYEFALEMNRRKQRYCLNSNAQIWNENAFQAITDEGSSCYQLIFSVDGLYSKSNDTIRAGSSLEKTLKNIDFFIRLKKEKKSKIDFGLKIVNKGQDYKELEDFIFHWLSNKDISFVSCANFMSAGNSEYLRHYPCEAFYDKGVLAIRHTGTIIRCAYNEDAINDRRTYLGNIKNYKTISEAYNSTAHNNLRREDSDKTFSHPCDKCSIAYCGRGFQGMITFRDEEKREKIPQIYFHNDSFQNFYSLKDTSKTDELFKINTV